MSSTITYSYTFVITSSSNYTVETYSCGVLLIAVNLFCFAAILFPVGFSVPEIGGAPYQLPNSYQVGLSYILFIMALWTAVISELFTSRIPTVARGGGGQIAIGANDDPDGGPAGPAPMPQPGFHRILAAVFSNLLEPSPD